MSLLPLLTFALGGVGTSGLVLGGLGIVAGLGGRGAGIGGTGDGRHGTSSDARAHEYAMALRCDRCWFRCSKAWIGRELSVVGLGNSLAITA